MQKPMACSGIEWWPGGRQMANPAGTLALGWLLLLLLLLVSPCALEAVTTLSTRESTAPAACRTESRTEAGAPAGPELGQGLPCWHDPPPHPASSHCAMQGSCWLASISPGKHLLLYWQWHRLAQGRSPAGSPVCPKLPQSAGRAQPSLVPGWLLGSR